MKKERTIEVLNEGALEDLNIGVEKPVYQLIDHWGANAVLPINPLVIEFQKLQKFKDYKQPENVADDKDAYKEADKLYKEAWKDIRAFRAKVKKTKKEMKSGILEIGKALDAVENTFVDSATDIEEEVNKEFAQYLEEKERAKKEAEAKKEAARQEELKKVQEEAQAQVAAAKKAQAFNAVKYDALFKAREDGFSDMERMNEASIDNYVLSITKYSWDQIARNYLEDPTLIDYIDEMEELQLIKVWNDTKEEIRKRYMEIKERMKEEAIAKYARTAPEPPLTPAMQAHSDTMPSHLMHKAHLREMLEHYANLPEVVEAINNVITLIDKYTKQ